MALLEAGKAREIVHKLVVKIIVWRSGFVNGLDVGFRDKITVSEWFDYKKHILDISKIESREKVENKIQKTREAIEKNGGFE